MQSKDETRQAAHHEKRDGRYGAVIFGLLGLVIGGAFGRGPWASISGLGLGLLYAAFRRASKRGDRLEHALAQVEQRVRGLEAGGAGTPSVEPPAAPGVVAPPAATPGSVTAPPSVPAGTRAPAPAPPRAPVHDPGPSRIEEALLFVRGLFFGGNTVVRVAVLVLLVGVTVLVQWAVENDLFPIEARLASASAIGLALTGVGYWLRDRNAGFGTTLQGGGVAALYLVVFFAYRVYELIPAELAFGLFSVIAVAVGILAVAQSAQPLIFIGSLGGFLAPILSSSNQGNHVVLFSYYLVLNVAIAAVAWHKTWRALNVLAFVCTYGVATVWGVLRYRPEHFASTEPFLLAYMLLFTGIAVVFAMRQPPRLAGLVDGTLVFGTPLVTLLAQARLVEHMEFGVAYSTAGFGLFYAAAATFVWRYSPGTLRRLAEAFVSLAVVFGTMAIPLALEDGLSTTLVWSLEGAGLYWVGARQSRRLARMAGIGLQVLAAGAFAWGIGVSGFHVRSAEFMRMANPRFLAGLAMAISGFFIAREGYALRAHMGPGEWRITQLLAGWGLLWWAGATLSEIDQFVQRDHQATATLLLLAASGVALERAARWLDWLPGRVLAGAVLPAAALALPLSIDNQPHLFAHGGFFAWPLALAAVYLVLGWIEQCEVGWTRYAYGPALWLLALVTAFALAGLVDIGLDLEGDWPAAAFGIGLGAVLLGAHSAMERGLGAFGRHARLMLELGAGPVVALTLLYTLVLNATATGAAAPLPYLPLLNPADVTLAWVSVAVLTCWNRLTQTRPDVVLEDWTRFVGPLLGALAFVWLNGTLVRSVYQWTDVAFDADALWDSSALQVSLSIAWTLVALAGMLVSSKQGWRLRWLTFATLLGVVVVKLFVVDLTQLGTPAKIGTFLCVGVLLLVIGYLSPVPPAREDDLAGGPGDDPALAHVEGGDPS